MFLSIWMDERALATACLNHCVSLKKPISLGYGIRIDLQILCQLPNSGQRRARLQFTALHRLGDLSDELREHRFCRSFIDRDLHGYDICSNCTDSTSGPGLWQPGEATGPICRYGEHFRVAASGQLGTGPPTTAVGRKRRTDLSIGAGQAAP